MPLIRRLIAEFPERRIRTFVRCRAAWCQQKSQQVGRVWRTKRKHEILVLTDGRRSRWSSISSEVAAPFADSSTGAVTVLSRLVEPNLGFRARKLLARPAIFFAGVLMAEWMEA